MPFNPVLPLIDLVSPYLPSSLADPLYTLATFDFSNLASHPTQIFPLILSLIAAYWAWLSFLSSARFAFRTTVSLLKWGAVASVLGAAYLGYQSAGTEKGVVGGLSDAAHTANIVGKGVYSLGRKGAGYYFGQRGASSKSKRSASGRSRSWARPTNDGSSSWDDPSDRNLEAEDFVGELLKKAQGAAFEFLSPPQEKVKKTAKKSKSSVPSFGSGGSGGGLSGLAYDLAMGKAKKAFEEFTEGLTEEQKPKSKKSKYR
ncbi:hypothetical protein JCM8547_002934 [Rhodosporidiobolus lusitaniae]